VLPESLAPEKRSPWNWRRANPVGALQMLRACPGLPSLAVVGFLGMVAQNILPTMTVLYAINRYGFKMHQISWMLGGMGICSAFVGGVLTGRVVRAVGERPALMMGLAFGITGFTFMGLAPTALTFLLAIPVLSLRGLADPALSALMSRKVAGTEQGALQGAMSSLMGIAGLVAPTLYTETYAYFADPHMGWSLPGAPYLIAALLLVVAASLTASRYAAMKPAVVRP
jgi:DHA1 family tetracycline resistance protein-like MFS transporter